MKRSTDDSDPVSYIPMEQHDYAIACQIPEESVPEPSKLADSVKHRHLILNQWHGYSIYIAISASSVAVPHTALECV